MNTSLTWAVVGTGNLAWHLCRRAEELGIQIHLFGRGASKPSEFNVIEYHHGLPSLQASFDVIFLAIPDQTIGSVSQELKNHSALLIHGSGSTPIEALQRNQNMGVIYPFQTLSKGKAVDWNTFPVFFEGDENVQQLAHVLSAHVIQLNSEKRFALHLAGVLANNFSNAVWHAAELHLIRHGLNPEWMQPLMKETLEKYIRMGGEKAQTGPALRHDLDTQKKHSDFLSNDPSLQDLYRSISKWIEGFHHKRK